MSQSRRRRSWLPPWARALWRPPPKVTAMWTWPSTPLPTPSSRPCGRGTSNWRRTGGVCVSSRTPRAPDCPAGYSTRAHAGVDSRRERVKAVLVGWGMLVSLWRPNGRIYSDSYYKPYPGSHASWILGSWSSAPFPPERSKRPGVQLPVLKPVSSVVRGARNRPHSQGVVGMTEIMDALCSARARASHTVKIE